MTVEGQILQKRGIMSREQKTAVNSRKNGYLLETKCPVVIFQSLLIRLLSVQSHSLQRKKGLKLTEPKFIVILWELMPATAQGQCHEIFCFWFFHQSVSPQPQSIPLGPFQIFSKIHGDIRS